MAEKIEKKKEKKTEGFSFDEKVKAIQESKMPLKQKEELLKEIGVLKEDAPKGVTFTIYAQVKKITKTMHKAMQLYSEKKKVSLASLEEWESVFKDF